MTPKVKYCNLIKKNSINNILLFITEISYSKKYNIINKLLNQYDFNTINKALNVYKLDYIDLNRIELIRIYQILKYYCERYKND